MPDQAVADKLTISPDKSLTFFNPPDEEELPEGLTQDVSISEGDPADILLAFIDDQLQLKRNLLALKSQIKLDGSLWIAWRKGGPEMGLTGNFITKLARAKNLEKVSEIKLSDTWTALQFKIED
jgi:hypothetical protein